nr:hypothetical protein [Tanacetum cinerariifolium]
AGSAVIEANKEIFVFGSAVNKMVVRAPISPLFCEFIEEAEVLLSQGILLEDGKMVTPGNGSENTESMPIMSLNHHNSNSAVKQADEFTREQLIKRFNPLGSYLIRVYYSSMSELISEWYS